MRRSGIWSSTWTPKAPGTDRRSWPTCAPSRGRSARVSCTGPRGRDGMAKSNRSIVGQSAGRPRDDFYPSPRSATLALLSVERFEGTIWEPACGNGAISRVLEEQGHEVVSTDLIDRGYGTGGIRSEEQKSEL